MAMTVHQATRPAAPARSFTAREFRDAMGQFATGVVIVSVAAGDATHAMTANAFMSGSLEPPLIVVSIAHRARMHERIGEARCFAISMLAESQIATSSHFAGKPASEHPPRFERLCGVPVLVGAGTRLVAEKRAAHACGDHTLFVGEVLAIDGPSDKPRPLLFHAGRYGEMAPNAWSAESVPEGFWAWHSASLW